jgi:hypothetical protein
MGVDPPEGNQNQRVGNLTQIKNFKKPILLINNKLFDLFSEKIQIGKNQNVT